MNCSQIIFGFWFYVKDRYPFQHVKFSFYWGQEHKNCSVNIWGPELIIIRARNLFMRDSTNERKMQQQ